MPFNFPAYVNPLGNKNTKGEKISLSVNMGADAEVLCQTTSHPLKVNILSYSSHLVCDTIMNHDFSQVVRRHSGKLSLSYEAQVAAWSSADFSFSYIVKTLN